MSVKFSQKILQQSPSSYTKKLPLHAVILAGGSGERLWPLSRKKHPKQTLPFRDQKSLLELTLDRLDFKSPNTNKLIPPEQRWVITSAEQEHTISKIVTNRIHKIITEPVARNTAPAMLLASLVIARENPEAVIIFLPSDHYIPQSELFWNYVNCAYNYASTHETIVLFGLKPTYPATGYGYIQPTHISQIHTTKTHTLSNFLQDKISALSPVRAFKEKPNHLQALEYLKQNYFWNSGIVIAQAKVFNTIAQETIPLVYQALTAYLENTGDYAASPAVSVDYGIMEKSNKITVLPVDFIWHDVGNLETFLSLSSPTKSPKKSKELLELNAHNNLTKLKSSYTAIIGLDNLCVIQQENILLIANRTNIEQVREVALTLKKRNLTQYL